MAIGDGLAQSGEDMYHTVAKVGRSRTSPPLPFCP
jgi:hypothetical protein